MITKLKERFLELKEAFDVRTDELIWITSKERLELARERIAALNRGENPYLDMMDE